MIGTGNYLCLRIVVSSEEFIYESISEKEPFTLQALQTFPEYRDAQPQKIIFPHSEKTNLFFQIKNNGPSCSVCCHDCRNLCLDDRLFPE